MASPAVLACFRYVLFCVRCARCAREESAERGNRVSGPRPKGNPFLIGDDRRIIWGVVKD